MTDHRQFFRLALAEAWGSPDPSTQTGAIIVDAGGRVVSGGCNDFPEGVAAKPERLERPLKYSFMEHAERNAIYSAGEIVDTDVMYALWAACDDCARAVKPKFNLATYALTIQITKPPIPPLKMAGTL